jgi:hypothetical protein
VYRKLCSFQAVFGTIDIVNTYDCQGGPNEHFSLENQLPEKFGATDVSLGKIVNDLKRIVRSKKNHDRVYLK